MQQIFGEVLNSNLINQILTTNTKPFLMVWNGDFNTRTALTEENPQYLSKAFNDLVYGLDEGAKIVDIETINKMYLETESFKESVFEENG